MRRCTMGLFEKIFGLKGSESRGEAATRGKKDHATGQIRVDRYKPAGEGKHVHEAYNKNTRTGKYSEYRGGENSPDRSYNKGSGGKKSK
jgi:hypothetical protein